MMPKPSIAMIRLSLIYLLITICIGGLLLAHKAIAIHPALWTLQPVHFELAIWGWLVQFVMGTAYWMFPKYLTGKKRGNEAAAWLVFILFNSGLLMLILSPALPVPLAAATARFLILTAVIFFILIMWNRIISYRKKE